MCLDERGVKEFGSHVLGLTNLTSATSLQQCGVPDAVTGSG